MTADELSGIETTLGISLPNSYRAAMMAYPLDPSDPDARIALEDDARAIEAFNRFLREECTGKWRPSYFAFGANACGDSYFLDLGSGADSVWVFDHETHQINRLAPDLKNWLAGYPAGNELDD